MSHSFAGSASAKHRGTLRTPARPSHLQTQLADVEVSASAERGRRLVDGAAGQQQRVRNIELGTPEDLRLAPADRLALVIPLSHVY